MTRARQRLAKLEAQRIAAPATQLRLVMSDDPPPADPPMTPRAPGTIPGHLVLIYGGREYDPADLGW